MLVGRVRERFREEFKANRAIRPANNHLSKPAGE
jgi:hypothetical protein